jgi:tRNA modification GTPase
LNKSDLVDVKDVKRTVSEFTSEGKSVVAVSAMDKKAVDLLYGRVFALLKEKLDKNKEKGIFKPIRIMVAGIPNTGKSTILNLLAEKERAIVTDIAGTTRDVISETVAAGNVTLRLSDTAGVHGTDDFVESIGVQKSIEALEEAELILAVFDLSRGLDAEDEEILSHVAGRAALGIPVIAICNKSDLFDSEQSEHDTKKIANALGTDPILLCAKNQNSRETLVSLIENIFESSDISSADNAVITNARQFAAVNEALSHAQSALFSLDYLGEDTACAELELAMGKLGELDGRQVTIDIVDSIFHRFCVGK